MDKTSLLIHAQSPAGVHLLARQALADQVRRISSGNLSHVQIPPSAPLFNGTDGDDHYHSVPELFLQVSGASRMRLTTSLIRNAPGGLLLIPRGVSHQESADSTRSPFCNLVFMHSPGQLHYHAGLSCAAQKVPAAAVRIGGCCDCAHPYGSRFYGYLNEAADFVAGGHPVRHPFVQGLLLAHLGQLQALLEQSASPTASAESPLVARCRRMVQEQLADSRLSVQRLAGQLRCTPDYLSNRFRRESGLRLTVHINQERCRLARHLLAATPWNVKEIAARCGYADAGYFSRIFTRLAGVNPRNYRH